MAFLAGLILSFVPILASARSIGSRRFYLAAAAASIAAGALLHALCNSVYRPAGDLPDAVLIPLGGGLLMFAPGLVVAAVIARKVCPSCAGRLRRPAVICRNCGYSFVAEGD